MNATPNEACHHTPLIHLNLTGSARHLLLYTPHYQQHISERGVTRTNRGRVEHSANDAQIPRLVDICMFPADAGCNGAPTSSFPAFCYQTFDLRFKEPFPERAPGASAVSDVSSKPKPNLELIKAVGCLVKAHLLHACLFFSCLYTEVCCSRYLTRHRYLSTFDYAHLGIMAQHCTTSLLRYTTCVKS